MNIQSIKRISRLYRSLSCNFSTKVKGSLYTWGDNTNSLGYAVASTTQSTIKPKKVVGLPNNITKVSMGYNHSLAINDDGILFSFGRGNYGALGHNDGEKSHFEPKEVEFFTRNNLKVKDISCGEASSIILTEDGDIWTWGYGGRKGNFLMDIIFLSIGALGHGDRSHRYTPTPIESLRNLPPFKKVNAGLQFASCINEKNQVYDWGRGDYGVFGNGSNKSLLHPFLNDYFMNLQEIDKLEIVDMKSVNNYSVALLSDNHLYGWGSNESGQMGIKTEIGVEMYETANFPTHVVCEDFVDTKINKYEVGEDCMAILLEDNRVFWAGMKLAYKPEQIPLPKDVGRIKLIGAAWRTLALVTENNEIYMKNKFVHPQEENIETGIFKTDNSIFDGGNILEIGGNYRNRYAIIEN